MTFSNFFCDSIERSKLIFIFYGVNINNKKDIEIEDDETTPNAYNLSAMCFYCIKEGHKHKSCHVLKRWKTIKIIKLTQNDLIQFRYLQVKLCVAYMLRNEVIKSIMVAYVT